MTIKEVVFCDGVNDHVEFTIKLKAASIRTIGKFGEYLVPVSATCECEATCCGFGSVECKMTEHKALYD